MVSVLLPLYEDAPNKDGQLIRYARAAVAQHDGRTRDAIRLYRDMLAENGDLPPVRLQLALALAADRQDAAAEDQFTRLRSDDLPADIREFVEQQLSKLQARREWSFNFSAYYQSDDNINNVPAQQNIAYANSSVTYPAPIKAKGIHYYFSTDKTIPISGGFYGGFNAGISGDQWNKKEYNDIQITVGTTFGWRDTRSDLRINPFVRRRIHGGKAYAVTAGANLNGDYWLTPNWRLSANTMLAHIKYDQSPIQDANQYYAGLSGLYAPSAGQYFFGGLSLYRSRSKNEQSDTYNRPSLYLGWGQEWPYGISSRLSGSLSRRYYAAPMLDFNIDGIRTHKRRDKEYSASLSLWKRDWHFWGITPKLVIDWSKTDSNHFYHDGKNSSNAYIEFSKTF